MNLRWMVGLLIWGQSVATAQEEVSVKWSAEIRARSEADDRDFNSKTDVNTYTYLRTRVGAMFQPMDNLHAFIQVQDSRVFGKEPTTLSNTANLDLHQAYVVYREFLWEKLDVKLGRMEVNYGDQRLVGAVGWSNIGRSFDGSIVTVHWTEAFKTDLFTFDIQETSTPAAVANPAGLAGNIPDEEDMFFTGMYAMYKPSDRYAVDIYAMLEADGTNRTSDGKDTLVRATIGTFSRGEFGAWSYKAELAFQAGKNGGDDISATTLTGSLTYSLRDAAWQPALTLGADFLSGDNQIDDKIHSFNTLYPTNHKFYGYMDYFIDIPLQTQQLGLLDVMARIKTSPSEKWSLGLDAHVFRSAKKSAANGSHLGLEFDLTAGYRFNKHFAWDAGVGLFAPGKLMKSIFGTDDVGVWSYGATTFSF